MLNSVSFFELIDSAACIYEFLPTGEKGMAFAANIHFDGIAFLVVPVLKVAPHAHVTVTS